MKKALALLLVVLLAITALCAKSINMGMDIKECKNPVVVDFLNYLIDNGLMDNYFYYYNPGIDEVTGEYYVSLTPIGSYRQSDLVLYFSDDSVEFFWYGDEYINDDNYMLMLYLINEFTNSYANWATFFIDDYYRGGLSSASVMSLAGVESYGEAIWSHLDLFITLSDMGFCDIEKSLEDYLNNRES